MDLPTVAAGATGAGAIIAAFIAVRRLPGQERSEAVNTHHAILTDMKLLNDTLVAECGRLRAREQELVDEIALRDSRELQLELELQACRERRGRLEAEVRRRGLDTA